jgi:thiamine-phosphate pyrophosphorylase
VKPLAQCQLYTFVDTAYLQGRNPVELTRQLCAGGSDLIQLRAKDSTQAEIARLARAILPVTRAAGVGLVINDHWSVACAVGAELCHLGQEDFFEAGHRHASDLPDPSDPSNLSEGKARPRELPRLGLSTHAPAQAIRALAAGADYLAIGPVYATGTKPSAKPVTLEYVRWAAANVSIPWFAIGGITLANLDDVLQAGARRVCVVSAILNAPDVAAACAAFKTRLPKLETLD